MPRKVSHAYSRFLRSRGSPRAPRCSCSRCCRAAARSRTRPLALYDHGRWLSAVGRRESRARRLAPSASTRSLPVSHQTADTARRLITLKFNIPTRTTLTMNESLPPLYHEQKWHDLAHFLCIRSREHFPLLALRAHSIGGSTSRHTTEGNGGGAGGRREWR